MSSNHCPYHAGPYCAPGRERVCNKVVTSPFSVASSFPTWFWSKWLLIILSCTHYLLGCNHNGCRLQFSYFYTQGVEDEVHWCDKGTMHNSSYPKMFKKVVCILAPLSLNTLTLLPRNHLAIDIDRNLSRSVSRCLSIPLVEPKQQCENKSTNRSRSSKIKIILSMILSIMTTMVSCI